MNILHILSERELSGPDFVFQSLESLNEDFGFIPAEQTCLAQHFHVCHRTGHIVNCQPQVQFPVLSHREIFHYTGCAFAFVPECCHC